MLSSHNAIVRCNNAILRCNRPMTWHRNASLNSSISRGVRKAAAALGQAEKRRLREGELGFWELKDQEKVAQARQNAVKKRQFEEDRQAHIEFLSSDFTVPSAEAQERDYESEVRKRIRARARAKGMLVDLPSAVPYTHAASEFLYGTFAVLAALRANRRKFYTLYIWCGEDGDLYDNDSETAEIVRRATAAKVPVKRVAGGWEKMLDRMSGRRPHNGLVLEAAAIPKLSGKCLDPVTTLENGLTVNLHYMGADEQQDLGISTTSRTYTIPKQRRARTFPFLLWLDKVTDTGNMGAIFRSAYYLGADAVIVPRHGTAPISALTIKTSAGAAEHVPIITIDNEIEFMQQSQSNGWVFFAAGAEGSKSTRKRASKSPAVPGDAPETLLSSKPCVLMMGNEGDGLRDFLQKQADHMIAVEGGQPQTLVDSLNVSVAAALLMHRFLVPSTSRNTSGVDTSKT